MINTQLAFYVNLHRAVIGPSATLTGRRRPDIDLRRMLTGYMLGMQGKNFSRQHFEIFSYFLKEIGFDISCKLSPKKCQINIKKIAFGNKEHITD